MAIYVIIVNGKYLRSPNCIGPIFNTKKKIRSYWRSLLIPGTNPKEDDAIIQEVTVKWIREVHRGNINIEYYS